MKESAGGRQDAGLQPVDAEHRVRLLELHQHPFALARGAETNYFCHIATGHVITQELVHVRKFTGNLDALTNVELLHGLLLVEVLARTGSSAITSGWANANQQNAYKTVSRSHIGKMMASDFTC